ncbi:LOW QUALITY PROTEIN: nuclear envelope integral membrane protein 1a-like [Glossina fuscipes]|uniref:LOW QUALITY PROTEIN: nuclear envelope integral membrane protein 1a-like n=1 Tax=Glossina fuscipes TaxID=7396 RepID=A0A8U0WH70_9MUSC|nr:LOW QUALITY PROTEIN: nuclear envelope integral membrane protein 1a-like [Glossina fuscipes]
MSVILTFFTVAVLSQTPESIIADKVNYVDLGKLYTYKPKRNFGPFTKDNLYTFCYRAKDKTISSLFETVKLRLNIEGDNYKQYDGATPDEVRQHYNQEQSLFSLTLFSQKRVRLHLSSFVFSNCLGMASQNPYTLELKILRIDFYRVIQLLLGYLVFQYASNLSQNAIFYYVTGIVLGICSLFMLLIWLTSSKLVPRRPAMYGILIGGWTVGLWMIQLLWMHMPVIIVTYRIYVFWYIMITGSISFIVCYRWAPPINQRSKNITKWLLQLASLTMIYFSSFYEEATSAIIITVVASKCFPKSLWYKCRSYRLRKFPPKIRLLTLDEFYEQGVFETKKALEDLRKYAARPDCKQWTMMTKLRVPWRFPAFVERATNLEHEEVLRFESLKYSAADDENSDISTGESENEENLCSSSFTINDNGYSSRTIPSYMYRVTSIHEHRSTNEFDDKDV